MPDPPSYDDLDHLCDSIERLTDHIELLTRAIDDLSTEIQWHNNQTSHDHTPPPLSLSSFSLDPTTSNLSVNEACAADIESDAAISRTQKPLFD